jgi:basic membrane protein A and related proteins
MTRLLFGIVLGLALAAFTGSEAPAAKQYRVAFVTERDGAGTPIMQQAVGGLRRGARDFGVDVRVVVQPIRTSRTSTFEELARQGYDLVIAAFPDQLGAVLAAARAYPDQRFLVGDSRSEHWPANVQGLSGREEEIGFVVGYLAGLVERRRPGLDAVSSVGGGRVPAVDRFIAGYQAGARRASPDIRLLNTYAYNFWDPDPCRRIAEAQIAKGVGVVFDVAGACGFGALAAARKHHVWGIGVDQDVSGLGPFVLASAVKDLGLLMYRVIQRLVQGRLGTGGDMTLGLKDGFLRLGSVSPLVPRALVERTRQIERAVASGQIKNIPTKVGAG